MSVLLYEIGVKDFLVKVFNRFSLYYSLFINKPGRSFHVQRPVKYWPSSAICL